MEWGVWIGWWGVGKHLAGDFSVILGETLGFWGEIFYEFLEVGAEGIDIGD